MRDHLSVLAEIQGHISTHRYDLAAEIAEQRLGMSSLKLHGAHEVEKYMPKGMQNAGSAMHHSASKFALAAQESAIDNDMGKSVAALATLTQACVACHAVYRLR
jgi:mono/diheme cytochrome c family protein